MLQRPKTLFTQNYSGCSTSCFIMLLVLKAIVLYHQLVLILLIVPLHQLVRRLLNKQICQLTSLFLSRQKTLTSKLLLIPNGYFDVVNGSTAPPKF